MAFARNNKRIKRQFDADFPLLIIEDQKSVATLLATYLKNDLDCDIDIVYSYEELTEKIKEEKKYGFAICDLGLPDDNTGESAKLLKKVNIPFCIMSATFGEGVRDLVYNLGAIDYFQKEGNIWLSDILYLIKRTNRNSKITALIVDDQKTQRAIQNAKLKTLNLKTIEAEDGLDALKKLKENPEISLILTDFEMPKLSGTQLVIEVRKKYAKDEIAIIGISATEDPRIVAKFIKAGSNDCMKKNVSNEEFLCRLNQNIEMLELTKAHKESAIKDFLTGLPNRRYFFTEGINIYNKFLNKLENLSAAIIDIDYFKKINDIYGHEVGDDVLVFIGNMFKEHFKGQVFARLGGEEFGILFNGNKNDAYIKLEKFRKIIENSEIYITSKKTEKIKITISSGVVSGVAINFDEMLNNADEALYKAKESGRNKVVIG